MILLCDLYYHVKTPIYALCLHTEDPCCSTVYAYVMRITKGIIIMIVLNCISACFLCTPMLSVVRTREAKSNSAQSSLHYR